jgi:predicted TIM-barrel fold metal-dependent hydrolase
VAATPLDIVDSHTHVVSADTERYPISPGMDEEQDWHRARPVDAEGLLARADAAGVSALAFVQALSSHGYDNRYVLDAARAHPGRAIAVVAVRAEDPDATTVLEQAVADGAAGVRVLAPMGASGGGFDEPAVQRLAEAAGGLGVPVVLLGVARHLPSIAPLVRARPDTSFVVDHCGFADFATAASDSARALHALADASNATLKVSTINLQSVGDPAALWAALVARFGAGRLMWGSDHPHSDGPGYGPLVDLARASTEGLADADRAAVLAGTARRLWPGLAVTH